MQAELLRRPRAQNKPREDNRNDLDANELALEGTGLKTGPGLQKETNHNSCHCRLTAPQQAQWVVVCCQGPSHASSGSYFKPWALQSKLVCIKIVSFTFPGPVLSPGSPELFRLHQNRFC